MECRAGFSKTVGSSQTTFSLTRLLRHREVFCVAVAAERPAALERASQGGPGLNRRAAMPKKKKKEKAGSPASSEEEEPTGGDGFLMPEDIEADSEARRAPKKPSGPRPRGPACSSGGRPTGTEGLR